MSPDGVVYLVGAGPGDPRLVTMRGAELLGRADVVLYDRLVDPSLLELAPGALHVYAGRAPGDPDAQSEVNEKLIAHARDGRTVVRLKGGDPFVFGRGGEEAEALVAAGVRFEVVPGVTSAIAAPAYGGIPVTHRRYSSWVAIATGHEEPGKQETTLDWESLARAPTAVFLMGVRRVREVAARLMASGRDPLTPAAVVASATLAGQQTVRSTLSGIADAAQAAAIQAPATLVVGAVAEFADTLDWVARGRPLAGRRVFITRPAHQAAEIIGALRELGAEPLAHATIRICPPERPEELDEALERLRAGRYAWLILTSANAVDAVRSRLEERGHDARALAGTMIACVGDATSRHLAAWGLRADLVPDAFTARALSETLGRPPASSDQSHQILYPRSAAASGELEHALQAAGWRVDVVDAYRTLADHSSSGPGRAALDQGVDAILFSSGSTVRAFLDMWGPPPPDAAVCCIGPVTADVARDLGLRVDVVAAQQTAQGLVAAVTQAVGR